jgi:hypothetical protein
MSRSNNAKPEFENEVIGKVGLTRLDSSGRNIDATNIALKAR